MNKLGNEVKTDLDFLKSHTLQPKWYKVLKVFILLGIIIGYYLLFGLVKSIVFFACFVLLCLVIHFTYRIKTKKYTQSWLDFVVEDKPGAKPRRIGKFYYPAIIFSAISSFVISQLIGK